MFTQSFNDAQALKASNVVLNLMKTRRIFPSSESTLDPATFRECLALNKEIRDCYKATKLFAEHRILSSEKEFGIVPQKLKDGQEMVLCPFYSSGIEIVGAYPIGKFLPFMPKNRDSLYDEIFVILHRGVEFVAPVDFHDAQTSARDLTDLIWEELIAINREAQKGVILVMETKFRANFEEGFAILREKVAGLSLLPNGLAYLMYKNEKEERLIKNHMLFDANILCHTVICHDALGNPKIRFKQDGGYSNTVTFVCLV